MATDHHIIAVDLGEWRGGHSRPYPKWMMLNLGNSLKPFVLISGCGHGEHWDELNLNEANSCEFRSLFNSMAFEWIFGILEKYNLENQDRAAADILARIQDHAVEIPEELKHYFI